MCWAVWRSTTFPKAPCSVTLRVQSTQMHGLYMASILGCWEHALSLGTWTLRFTADIRPVKRLPYHHLGVCVCTLQLHGALGFWKPRLLRSFSLRVQTAQTQRPFILYTVCTWAPNTLTNPKASEASTGLLLLTLEILHDPI